MFTNCSTDIPMGYTLLQAHLIMRHGDRAPTTNIYLAPNNQINGKTAESKATAEHSYWNSQMPSMVTLRALSTMFPVTFLEKNNNAAATKLGEKKDYPFGMLTRRGLSGTYSLGKELRKIYVDQARLLPSTNTCSADVISARSTSMNRTVESCQSVLHGFCKPTSLSRNKDGAIIGTVNVHVETGQEQTMPNFGKYYSRDIIYFFSNKTIYQ